MLKYLLIFLFWLLFLLYFINFFLYKYKVQREMGIFEYLVKILLSLVLSEKYIFLEEYTLVRIGFFFLVYMVLWVINWLCVFFFFFIELSGFHYSVDDYFEKAKQAEIQKTEKVLIKLDDFIVKLKSFIESDKVKDGIIDENKEEAPLKVEGYKLYEGEFSELLGNICSYKEVVDDPVFKFLFHGLFLPVRFFKAPFSTPYDRRYMRNFSFLRNGLLYKPEILFMSEDQRKLLYEMRLKKLKERYENFYDRTGEEVDSDHCEYWLEFDPLHNDVYGKDVSIPYTEQEELKFQRRLFFNDYVSEEKEDSAFFNSLRAYIEKILLEEFEILGKILKNEPNFFKGAEDVSMFISFFRFNKVKEDRYGKYVTGFFSTNPIYGGVEGGQELFPRSARDVLVEDICMYITSDINEFVLLEEFFEAFFHQYLRYLVRLFLLENFLWSHGVLLPKKYYLGPVRDADDFKYIYRFRSLIAKIIGPHANWEEDTFRVIFGNAEKVYTIFGYEFRWGTFSIDLAWTPPFFFLWPRLFLDFLVSCFVWFLEIVMMIIMYKDEFREYWNLFEDEEIFDKMFEYDGEEEPIVSEQPFDVPAPEVNETIGLDGEQVTEEHRWQESYNYMTPFVLFKEFAFVERFLTWIFLKERFLYFFKALFNLLFFQKMSLVIFFRIIKLVFFFLCGLYVYFILIIVLCCVFIRDIIKLYLYFIFSIVHFCIKFLEEWPPVIFLCKLMLVYNYCFILVGYSLVFIFLFMFRLILKFYVKFVLPIVRKFLLFILGSRVWKGFLSFFEFYVKPMFLRIFIFFIDRFTLASFVWFFLRIVYFLFSCFFSVLVFYFFVFYWFENYNFIEELFFNIFGSQFQYRTLFFVYLALLFLCVCIIVFGISWRFGSILWDLRYEYVIINAILWYLFAYANQYEFAFFDQIYPFSISNAEAFYGFDLLTRYSEIIDSFIDYQYEYFYIYFDREEYNSYIHYYNSHLLKYGIKVGYLISPFMKPEYYVAYLGDFYFYFSDFYFGAEGNLLPIGKDLSYLGLSTKSYKEAFWGPLVLDNSNVIGAYSYRRWVTFMPFEYLLEDWYSGAYERNLDDFRHNYYVKYVVPDYGLYPGSYYWGKDFDFVSLDYILYGKHWTLKHQIAFIQPEQAS